MRRVLAAILLLASTTAWADHEPHFSAAWCEERGGEAEVILESRHRVDCVLPRTVVEVEWGAKYREGIGQALDYAEQTGDVPGLVLLVGDEDDEAGVERARAIVDTFELPIRVWAEDTR